MTSPAFYHAHPDALTVETEVVDTRPGRVVLAVSPFYPGGGGQLPDRGRLSWTAGETAIVGFEVVDGHLWHVLDEPIEVSGSVVAAVDPGLRRTMRQLHTATHILNALVYQAFHGALVTGAQLGADGTARMDFDLPDADNDRLRALEAPINEVIVQDVPVRTTYVPLDEAQAIPGLIRTQAVAPPPTADATIRIVEIVGVDRQACGGTHLPSTGATRPIRIVKIDNKGRHNRRVRIALHA